MLIQACMSCTFCCISSPWCAAHSHAAVTHHRSPIGTWPAAAPQTQSGAHLQETSHSLLSSAWKGQILGDTERFSQVQEQDRGQKELQLRKPYGASRTLSLICKKATYHFEILLEALSFSAGALHWNSGFSSPGIKAVEPCHFIEMEREQPNENPQQQNGSSGELLQKRLCWGSPPPPQTHRAERSTERLGEHSERLENDNRNNIFAFPDNDNPEFPLCAFSHWSLTQTSCFLSSAMLLVCLFFPRFLCSSAKHLPFYQHFSCHSVVLHRPKSFVWIILGSLANGKKFL